MFESTFVPDKSERTRTVAFVLILQTVAVTGLMLAPLLSVARIETNRATAIVAPVRRNPEPPPRAIPQPRTASSAFAVPRIAVMPTITRSFVAPLTVTALAPGDPPPYTFGLAAGTGPGIPDGALGGMAVPIAPPKQPKPEHPQPVHLTSALSQSQLVFGPKPEYPKLALLSRTEGVVRLQAVIAVDGTVKNLHVVEGSPLLTGAALAAVERWRYRPMILNGEATEVITEIDVHFTLRN